MNDNFEVRFGFTNNDGILENTKTVKFDSEESANKFFSKVIRFATNREKKFQLHGTVSLWNGTWRIKFTEF